MTNLEPRPLETVGTAGPTISSGRGGPEVLDFRLVPLGGPRAMTVRRTLPSAQRSLIGAFCFLDHYGPDDVAASGGMDVAPHPHAGLQTVTWLFEGQVLHRDALGSVQEIAPGQLNLMTSGRGISHSEEGTSARFPGQRILHGVQLWTALPDAHRNGPGAFEHVADVPTVTIDGARVQVFLGSVGDVTSPARVYTPLVAAQLDLSAGHVVRLPVRRDFEHGVLVDAGDVVVAGAPVPPAALAYLVPGRSEIVVEARSGPARVVLIGGEPFTEEVLMWWNFVGRTHDEVVRARSEWQDVVAGLDGPGRERFGTVVGYDGPPIPAPELPHVRLRPRRRSPDRA